MGNKKIILLLKFCVFSVFAGRGWLHLRWDAPYRAFFWDEALLSGLIESLTNMTWQEYVTSPDVDQFIVSFIVATGVLYSACAVACLLLKTNEAKDTSVGKWNKVLAVLIGLGTVFLVFLAFLYCKERFYHVGQFFEYAIQVSVPVFLLLAVLCRTPLPRLVLPMKVAIALTFICHGLYAYGYYPRPGPFVDMVLNILPLEESQVHPFLKIMGILDFIFAILLFVKPLARLALWYCVVWGLLTAFARLVANFYVAFPLDGLDFWFWEMFYRLSHGLLPLLVLMILRIRD